MMPKIRISLFLIFCFLTFTTFATTFTWLGGDGDWTDPANWDTGSVPGNGTEEVILTNGLITLDDYVQIRSLSVNSDASLHIAQWGEIALLADATVPLAIEVRGTVVVEGAVVSFLGSGYNSPYYLEMFDNGSWEVTTTGRMWLEDGGIRLNHQLNRFVNRGLSTVYGGVDSDLLLFINGVFTNEKEGNFYLDIGSMPGGATGINIHLSGELINRGSFQCYGQNNSFSNQNRIQNTGHLSLVGFRFFNLLQAIVENRRSGILEIRTLNAISFVALNSTNARIRNWGQFTVSNASGANGLRNNGRVDNYRVGRMNISGDYLYGHVRNGAGGTWNNYGRLTCGQSTISTRFGLRNEGDFRNWSSGSVEILGTYQYDGLRNMGVLLNHSYLSCNGSLRNEASFDNVACAELVLYDNLNNTGTGNFTNLAWLRWPATAAFSNTGNFESEGLIEDPYGNINPTQLINDGVLAQGKTTPVVVGNNPDFIVLGAWSRINTDGAVYEAPDGAQIGEYDPATNVFYAGEEAIGLTDVYLWTTTSDGACKAWCRVHIENGIEGGPAPFAPSQHPEPAVYSMEVYPNPTMAIVQLQRPADLSDQVHHWSLYDLRGSELSQGTLEAGEIATSIDLSHFSASNYVLYLRNDQGQRIGVERIIKQ